MAFNLIDSITNMFGNDLAGKASSLIGESEGSVKTAIGGIIPAVLTGLLQKAGSGDPSSVLSLVKDASQSGFLGNLTGALGNGSLLAKGTEMLKSLFGDKLGSISSLISGFAGIRESSASSLMSLAAPAALGVVGKHAAESNLNAGGLLSFLNTQKDSILSAVPSGLNLAGALGVGSLAGIGSKLSNKLSDFKGAVSGAGSTVSHAAAAVTPKSNSRWLPLVLGAVVVVGLLIFLGKGCNGSDKTAAVTDSVHTDTTLSVPVAPARESMKVKLPDGVELNAYRGGIEDQLVTFLNDPASKPGKDVWFDFDNLNFNTGSADLTDSSKTQVQNITAILKAYPKAKIKIGGYTDKTGDSTANLQLSSNRAKAVAAALKATGANTAQVLGAEGYGSQYAKVAVSATDDERKMDRRIAVSVREK